MKLIIRSNQDDNVFFEIGYNKDSEREFVLEQAINGLGYTVIDEDQEPNEIEINIFLSTWATKVRDEDNVELIMDDHFCIDYNDVEYYIPENNSFYTERDDEITEHLKEYYEKE